MLEQVDAHRLRRDLVVTDGLKGSAVRGVDQQNDDEYAYHRYQEREGRAEFEHLAADAELHVAEGRVLAQQV